MYINSTVSIKEHWQKMKTEISILQNFNHPIQHNSVFFSSNQIILVQKQSIQSNVKMLIESSNQMWDVDHMMR